MLIILALYHICRSFFYLSYEFKALVYFLSCCSKLIFLSIMFDPMLEHNQFFFRLQIDWFYGEIKCREGNVIKNSKLTLFKPPSMRVGNNNNTDKVTWSFRFSIAYKSAKTAVWNLLKVCIKFNLLNHLPRFSIQPLLISLSSSLNPRKTIPYKLI